MRFFVFLLAVIVTTNGCSIHPVCKCPKTLGPDSFFYPVSNPVTSRYCSIHTDQKWTRWTSQLVRPIRFGQDFDQMRPEIDRQKRWYLVSGFAYVIANFWRFGPADRIKTHKQVNEKGPFKRGSAPLRTHSPHARDRVHVGARALIGGVPCEA